ncbi:MAG: outer membrane protein transport protein [Proteobacteria bacterium]|nr:outer membrane protein transport protein [Pseudomonadota bacterium]
MKNVKLFLISFLLLMMSAGNAGAGYYSIYGLGSRASGMGSAYIALADDPSASYYNPGALSECGEGKLEMIVLRTFSQLNVEFDDASGTLLAQARKKGFSDLQSYRNWTKNVTELTILGLGLAMPIWKSPLLKNIEFGMSFSAPLSWAARFYFVESADPIFLEYFNQAQKFNIVGGMSYDIDGIFKSLGDMDIPGVSVGFGVNAFVDGNGTMKMMPTDFKLWLPYDYAIIGGLLLQPFQHFDNRLLRDLKLGATYHQAMMLDITFDLGLISNGSGGYAVGGSFSSYDLYFPEELGFGVGFAPLKNLAVDYDLVRSGWSGYKPPFTYAPPGSPIAALMGTPFDFKTYKLNDIWIHRIGAEYTLAKDYKFRLGYNFRPTPISSAMAQRANILDSNTNVISFGLGYNFTGLTVNLHSQVRMMANRTIRNNGSSIKSGGNVWSTGMTLSREFQTK